MEAANIIIARGLSVRDTENLVRKLQSNEPQPDKKPVDPDIKKLQDSLSQQFNLKVAIKHNGKGRGKLVIHYRNLNELDNLLEQFQTV